MNSRFNDASSTTLLCIDTLNDVDGINDLFALSLLPAATHRSLGSSREFRRPGKSNPIRGPVLRGLIGAVCQFAIVLLVGLSLAFPVAGQDSELTPAVAAASSATSLETRAARNSDPAPLNLLVIMVDDLGWGDLSCQGSTDLNTPHIDRLFAQSLVFDRFYANSCVCSPTRASLLTGRYPDAVGVPGVIRTHADNNWGYLAPVPTLADQLRSVGYHTSIVGKWHLGLAEPNDPLSRGFDRFHGFLGDMMDDYYSHLRHEQNYLRRDRTVIEASGHATDLFTDWACEELATRAESDSPFFLYLAYNAPHTPIQPPADWLEKVQTRLPQVPAPRQKLIALIEHLDDGIGRVLTQLDELGLSDSTLVVFTSDNGGQRDVGANNGAWRDGKQSMYEGGLLVPCAIRWPGTETAGRHVSIPAMTMDLFPTLCEAAGAQLTHEIDGQSFAGLFSGEKLEDWAERELYFVRREGGARYAGQEIRALIRGRWKLVQNDPFGPRELYDLIADPRETTDLAAKEVARVREMAQAMARHIQQAGSVPWQAPEIRDARER